LNGLLGFTIAFFLIGFVVLSLLKTNLQGKKDATQFGVWFVVGTTVWGTVSMFLFVWWFNATF
jgi:hypothetical protein